MLKNISHNNQKKIALINDFTGFGRCSIAVELPIISTLKVQCCPLPTSIFSNHTGFDSYFFDDYTDRMERYVEEWKKLDLSFNGICSGFLGSARQISIVKDFIKEFKTDDTIVVVDPVMGDYGKIYSTYTDEMCGLMKELVAGADIITPNITESCILTDTPYSDMLYDSICTIKELRPKAGVINNLEEYIVYENVKSEDVKLIESSWQKIRQKIKEDKVNKQMPVYFLLGDVSGFNVYNNNLYIIYGHGFEFAKKRLSNPETISYIEQMIRETINRSFSIKIILESEVKNIELEIKNEKVDKGEEILKSIVKDDILEIRDNEEKQD